MTLPAPTDPEWTATALGDPALAIAVYGLAAPQGSKKAYIRGGKARLTESSAKVKPWRAQVVATARDVAGHAWEPLDCPVVADVVFTMKRPVAASKRLRAWPMRTPDLDKLLRSTCDGLTDAGVWADDGRLVGFRRCLKVYVGDPDPDALTSPGALIRLWALPPQAA